jgi:hypothetical protein
MLSAEARQSSDLREVLPRVLMFPRKKTGPGRLLDPDAALPDRWIFTIRFLNELEHNHKCEPSEALEKIRCEMDTSVADKDDKTHWVWLTEELGLAERPKSNAEWRAAGRAFYSPWVALVEKPPGDHAPR